MPRLADSFVSEIANEAAYQTCRAEYFAALPPVLVNWITWKPPSLHERLAA